MPKISVIMPCLNMAKYIEESIESVLEQTLTDIEVLVIDAGSTDGTLDILERYVHGGSRDARVKLIHSEKKSYGYQVNMGIREARGEYIGIVDTDDQIVPDMYETLYPIAVSTGADYVKGTARFFYTIPLAGARRTDPSETDLGENSDGYLAQGAYVYQYKVMQFKEEEYGEKGIEVVPKDMPELLMRDSFLWYGIYRSDFMKKVELHESPGASYQDAGGLLQTQMRAGKAVYVKKPVYEYRQDNMSASEYNPKAFELILNEYAWSKRFLEDQPLKWKKAFCRKFFLHALTRFGVMVVSGRFWEEALPAMAGIRDQMNQYMVMGLIAEEDFEEHHRRQFRLFMENPRELYEETKKAYAPERDQLYQVLNAAGEKEMIIFGCGRIGSFLDLLMLHNDMANVVAFCDTNRAIHGKTLHGLTVLSPETAADRYPKAVYVIANKNSAEEMKVRLTDLGIEERNILCYQAGRDVRLLREKLV